MVKRTPSQKYRNVYWYPAKGTRLWGFVADHGMVNGARSRVRREGFAKEKEARDEQIAELAQGPKEKPAAGITLGAWVERWLALREPELAWGTVTGYRHALALFSSLSGVLLRDLGPAEIAVAVAEAQRTHKPNTVRQARRVLSACLNGAVAMELLDRNPVVKVKPPKAGTDARRFLTAAEVRRLLAAAAGTEWHLPLWVLAETWMRLGEVQALQWGDVREDGIRIERTARASAGGYVIGDGAKTTTSVRVIPITRELAAALDGSRAGLSPHPNRLVFDDGFGGMVNRDALRRALAGFCRTARVPLTTPHGLRHAGPSMALASGVDPKVVQERMGHASSAFMLDRYAHTNPEQHRRAADLIGAILGDTGT